MLLGRINRRIIWVGDDEALSDASRSTPNTWEDFWLQCWSIGEGHRIKEDNEEDWFMFCLFHTKKMALRVWLEYFSITKRLMAKINSDCLVFSHFTVRTISRYNILIKYTTSSSPFLNSRKWHNLFAINEKIA